jgi:hypothetical protein
MYSDNYLTTEELFSGITLVILTLRKTSGATSGRNENEEGMIGVVRSWYGTTSGVKVGQAGTETRKTHQHMNG